MPPRPRSATTRKRPAIIAPGTISRAVAGEAGVPVDESVGSGSRAMGGSYTSGDARSSDAAFPRRARVSGNSGWYQHVDDRAGHPGGRRRRREPEAALHRSDLHGGGPAAGAVEDRPDRRACAGSSDAPAADHVGRIAAPRMEAAARAELSDLARAAQHRDVGRSRPPFAPADAAQA